MASSNPDSPSPDRPAIREKHWRLGRWELSWWREETPWVESEVRIDTWLHLRRLRRRLTKR